VRRQSKEARKKYHILLLFVSTFFYAQGHGVVGKWKTIDHNLVRKKSVEIYENQEKKSTMM
jgi:hypothetical protein